MCGYDLVVLSLHWHVVVPVHRILLQESNYLILSATFTYSGKP